MQANASPCSGVLHTRKSSNETEEIPKQRQNCPSSMGPECVQHCLSAQAQLFRTNPTSIKHQEVSDGNGLCSEETELTKPTLSKASVIRVSLSAGACVFATAVLGSFLPLKPNLNWAWISAGAK